jgi:hypothetical protein
MTHPDMPELPGEIAYLQPHTLNSAAPKNFKYCLRKWPDEYRDWFPVYTAAQMHQYALTYAATKDRHEQER